MATLRDLRSDEVRPVPARTLVGRAPACALRLDDKHVSGEHAALIWTGNGWQVRDLGSRNGTFVDGTRVAPGEPVALRPGVRLGFGRHEDQFEVVDTAPPGVLAQEVETGAVVLAVGGMLALPDGARPEIVVYPDRTGRWVAEMGDTAAHPVSDQQLLQAGGQSWRVHVPDRLEGTATVDAGPTIDTVGLRFAVSRDEEHVQITVLHRGQEIAMEPREHGYALLTLARQRLEDGGLPLSEQGWLDRDELLRMLGLDANALNVAIYRARGQLSDSGVEGAAGVVEVRRGQRRIGLEPERLEVVRL